VAKAKVTPEQWAEQRKLWERSATVSYADIAANLLISKALVGQESKRAGWVKSIYADHPLPERGVAKQIDNLQNPQQPAARALNLDGLDAKNADHVGNAPSAPADSPADRQIPELGAIPDMPAGLSFDEERDWIEKQVMARQTALNRVHARELKAAKATVYAAIKGAGKDGGYDAARTARQIVASMTEQHASELANEAGRVRLELGAYQGSQGPRPVRISVLLIPGYQIGGANAEPPAGSRKVEVKGMGEAARVARGEFEDVDAKEIGRE
jgi:hypothetical protein